MDTVRSSAIVSGRVQGVSFRWFTLQEAERLGLTGWVTNRPDGSVEVEVQGPAQAVGSFSEWLWLGPSAAQVVEVVTRDLEPVSGERGFRIRH